MAGEAAIRVQGLAELDAAFKAADLKLQVGLRAELALLAEPVRAGAEQRAMHDIRNVLSATAERDWWQMRVGSTAGLVYVAPATRRSRGGKARPNFGGLLMDRAMQPALDAAAPGIEAGVDKLIGRIADGF